MRTNLTRLLINLAIITTSVLLTLLLLNVAFQIAMPNIVSQKYFPRSLIHQLGKHYQTFYPSVNDGNLKHWTAVLGDSYAAGSGDSFIKNDRDYGIFHYLYKQTGENFYIFARSGFGSINSVREYFITRSEIDNSIFYPKMEEPGKLYFLFYEGNDLDNNLDHYNANKGYKYSSIDAFVNREIEKSSALSRWFELYFPVLDILDFETVEKISAFGSRHKINSREEGENIILFSQGKNSFIYPRAANSASLELSDKELKISLDIFFSSISYLKRRTNTIPITIVYIPSVVSSYSWENPVRIRTYHTDDKILINFQDNLKRSQFIRKKIAEFSSENKIDFIDTTGSVIEKGGEEYLHGLLDMGHFNSVCYELISKLLIKQ